MSDSHLGLPPGTPTCDSYERTDVRTNEEVGDLNNSLALRNAHEKNAQFDSTPRSNP